MAASDTKSLILYGNDYNILSIISDILIKKLFNITKLSKKYQKYEYTNTSGNNVEIDYKNTEYHFEMNYTEKCINFIKSILSNRNISNKQFVFVLSAFDQASLQAQNPLKQMIDTQNNCIFIILCKNLGKVHDSITSRSMNINTTFNIKKIKEKVEEITEGTIDDFVDVFYMNHRSIIGTIIYILSDRQPLLVLKHIDSFLDNIKKTKNQLQVVNTVRDLVYKIYHLSIPFTIIAYHIINKYSVNKKAKTDLFHQIVEISANCESKIHTTHKDIFIYEEYLLNIAQLLRK